MNNILATTSSFGSVCPEAIAAVRDAGYELVTNPFGRKLTEQELENLLRQHKPIGLLAGTEPVTGKVLVGAASFLKAVSRIGVGWDNVDHDTAAQLFIPVSRTEGVLDQTVAELTLGMILDAFRHISLHDRDMRGGVWKKRMGRLLFGKTVGIVGYGAIGRRVGDLCTAFGAEVVCADICCIESDCAVQLDLAELLRRSDVLTVHSSGNDCIISAEMLNDCKPGIVIVNTARGGLVDEGGLEAGLKDGRIGYACLDVFDDEPYTGPLLEYENTILTSHIGSYAQEARIEMERMAVANLLADLAAKG